MEHFRAFCTCAECVLQPEMLSHTMQKAKTRFKLDQASIQYSKNGLRITQPKFQERRAWTLQLKRNVVASFFNCCRQIC